MIRAVLGGLEPLFLYLPSQCFLSIDGLDFNLTTRNGACMNLLIDEVYIF
jgi:hypothetical protein